MFIFQTCLVGYVSSFLFVTYIQNKYIVKVVVCLTPFVFRDFTWLLSYFQRNKMRYLTFTTLRANSADVQLMIVFLFSQK